MKWLVGPRRIGKTTTLFEVAFKSPYSHLMILSPTVTMAKNNMLLMREFLRQKGVSFDSSRLDLNIETHETPPRKWSFVGVNFFEEPATAIEFRMTPKLIDDVDQFLANWFGRITHVSATGPTYDWPTPLPPEMIEQAKQQLPALQFENEILGKWEI